MAEVLSQITTCLNPDRVRSILDGITLGAAHRAEIYDPTIVEGDHDLDQEVCVAAGCMLVQMHMTDWAEAQREDPVLSTVLDWLGDHTLSLLQECFWWLGMTNQMWQSIKTSVHCLQHESGLSKAPLHPIMAIAPLDLLHVDFTSIETTLELNKSPKVANVLVFKDHFTKHVLAYVTPNQTAKTVAKFLYQGYILIFGAPARLLSDRGANFMSSVINEMCKILSVKKLWTMPYHLQTNGLVERSHQTIMRMIKKLGKDKKSDWPGHLAEIVHAYNATDSAMTGYSPHYLMFG